MLVQKHRNHKSLVKLYYIKSSVTRLGDFYKFLATDFSHKSSPNILVTFWAISNNVIIMKNVCGNFLGTFEKKLVNFLFHHLATLIKSLVHTKSDSFNVGNVRLEIKT